MYRMNNFKVNMFQPIAACRFRATFVFNADISDEYNAYISDQTIKIRINYIRKSIEFWTLVPEEGPLHDMLQWFTTQMVSIVVKELGNNGETVRVLNFDNYRMIDQEIIYDYSSDTYLQNYMVWAA